MVFDRQTAFDAMSRDIKKVRTVGVILAAVDGPAAAGSHPYRRLEVIDAVAGPADDGFHLNHRR